MALAAHISRETVEKLAREVAGIELSAAEVDQLTPQLDRLLGDLAQVPDHDLAHLEPPLMFDAGEA